MFTTVGDTLSGHLKLLEELGAGQTASAEDMADGLASLVSMLDSWSIQGDLVYTETKENLTFTANDGDYTIGTGGNFNTTRPIKIRAATTTSGGTDTQEITQISAEEYAAIPNKTQTGTPEFFYYDANYNASGLANIYFWPLPAGAYTLTLYSEKPLSTYSSISDTLVAPPGHERAYRYNLAVERASEYGKEAKPSVQKIARESKAAIRNQNALNDDDKLRCDDALLSSGFDIWTR